MPGLSYPYRYVCLECGKTTTITRTDADEVHSNPETSEARQIVLEQRGWRRGGDGLMCPDCAGTSE